jgi:hypothetical protein
MPTYEYRCPANDRVVEVAHPMAEKLSTWGQLCDRAGISPGSTPADAPVERLISLTSIAGSARADTPAAHTCGRPGCCMGNN